MSLPVILVGFLACAAVIVVAGTALARNGDMIAARTALGGLWVGSIFLAIATSLPELTTDVAAVLIELPDLAAGDLFGSSMANMLILGVISMMRGAELFRRAALDNTVSAALAIILTTLAAIALLVGPTASIGGISPGTIAILGVYLAGTHTIYRHSATAQEAGRVTEMVADDEEGQGAPAGWQDPMLRRAVAGFAGASLVILLVAPLFAGFAERLAEATGLSASFIGTWLVGISTSLPELVTCIAAVRIGAYDLAVGNLFGSNAFNMMLLFPLDAVHRPGPILEAIHPVHAVTALIAVILMSIGLAAIVYRTRTRMSILEPSSGLLLLGYLVGLGIVYWMSGQPA